MSKPLQQIVSEALSDFITQRKSTDKIVEKVKQDFSLRDEALDVADTLKTSPHRELQGLGKLVETIALGWNNETPSSYLRGTNIVAGKICTCSDPRKIDKTCPLYTTPNHDKIVAKRWVDAMMKP